MSSLLTSTPYQIPPCACFCRSLFNTLVASKPALSHSWRGITSSALAIAPINSCSLPAMVRECSRNTRDNSISIAPPPATTESFLMVLCERTAKILIKFVCVRMDDNDTFGLIRLLICNLLLLIVKLNYCNENISIKYTFSLVEMNLNLT